MRQPALPGRRRYLNRLGSQIWRSESLVDVSPTEFGSSSAKAIVLTPECKLHVEGLYRLL